MAAELRKARGEAWVVEVARIGGWSDKEMIALFTEARTHDYDRLIRDIRLALRPSRRNIRPHSLANLNRRLGEIVAIDSFGCPRRKGAEEALKELEARLRRALTAPAEPGREETPGVSASSLDDAPAPGSRPRRLRLAHPAIH